MALSDKDKREIVELYKMSETDGYEILREHFNKEVFNSVTKNATERDIAFNAGIKSVFDYVDSKIKLLKNR